MSIVSVAPNWKQTRHKNFERAISRAHDSDILTLRAYMSRGSCRGAGICSEEKRHLEQGSDEVCEFCGASSARSGHEVRVHTALVGGSESRKGSKVEENCRTKECKRKRPGLDVAATNLGGALQT
jgi:hypothetical protein